MDSKEKEKLLAVLNARKKRISVFDQQSSSTKSLLPFESQIIERNHIAVHPGSRVISFEWSPPIGVIPKFYCALSTIPETIIPFLNKKHEGKGAIQIWGFGSDIGKQKPILIIALLLNTPFCYDIKWLPSNCVEDDRDLKNKTRNKSKKFGILVAACSDGLIRIFNVPSLILNRKVSTFDVTALYVLGCKQRILWRMSLGLPSIKVNQGMPSMKLGPIPLLGGSSCGTIALWDLKMVINAEKLDIKANKNNLPPLEQWQGHKFPNAIRSLEWHPNEPFLFLSCGDDNRVIIWDIRKIRCSLISVNVNSNVIKAKWDPSGLPKILIVKDCFKKISSLRVLCLKTKKCLAPSFIKKCEKPSEQTTTFDLIMMRNSISNKNKNRRNVVKKQKIEEEKILCVESRETGRVYIHKLGKDILTDETFVKNDVECLIDVKFNKESTQEETKLSCRLNLGNLPCIKKCKVWKIKSYENRLNVKRKQSEIDERKADINNHVDLVCLHKDVDECFSTCLHSGLLLISTKCPNDKM